MNIIPPENTYLSRGSAVRISPFRRPRAPGALCPILIAVLLSIPPGGRGEMQGGWYEAGLQQFFPSATSASFNANQSSRTIDHSLPNIYTSSTWTGDASGGSWISYDLSWPDTLGTLSHKVSRVKIMWSETENEPFTVEVKADDSSPWIEAYSGVSDGIDNNYEVHNFPLQAAKHVRIVIPNGNSPSIRYIQFYGTVEGDTAAFVHPGMTTTSRDVSKIRQLVQNEVRPNLTAWQILQNQARSRTDVRANPSSHIQWTAVQTEPAQKEFAGDCETAYYQALMWMMTENPVYAENVLEIMDAWNTTLVSSAGNNALASFGSTINIAQAIELVKYSYAGWDAQIESDFLDLIENHVVAHIEARYFGANNWSAQHNKAIMGLAILRNDRYHFNRAVDRMKQIIDWTDAYGGVGELCSRDWNHALMQTGSIGEGAEVAWNQGVDLYSYRNNHVATIFNYFAWIDLVGGDSDEYTYPGCLVSYQNGVVKPAGVRLDPFSWENVYNHYANRVGVSTPKFEEKMQIHRTRNDIDGYTHHYGWGSLLDANVGDTRGDPGVDPPVDPPSDFYLSEDAWITTHGEETAAYDGGATGDAGMEMGAPVFADGMSFLILFTPAAADLTGTVLLMEIGGWQNGTGLYLIDGVPVFVQKQDSSQELFPGSLADTQLGEVAVASGLGELSAGTGYSLAAAYEPPDAGGTVGRLTLAIRPESGHITYETFEISSATASGIWAGGGTGRIRYTGPSRGTDSSLLYKGGQSQMPGFVDGTVSIDFMYPAGTPLLFGRVGLGLRQDGVTSNSRGLSVYFTGDTGSGESELIFTHNARPDGTAGTVFATLAFPGTASLFTPDTWYTFSVHQENVDVNGDIRPELKAYVTTLDGTLLVETDWQRFTENTNHNAAGAVGFGVWALEQERYLDNFMVTLDDPEGALGAFHDFSASPVPSNPPAVHDSFQWGSNNKQFVHDGGAGGGNESLSVGVLEGSDSEPNAGGLSSESGMFDAGSLKNLTGPVHQALYWNSVSDIVSDHAAAAEGMDAGGFRVKAVRLRTGRHYRLMRDTVLPPGPSKVEVDRITAEGENATLVDDGDPHSIPDDKAFYWIETLP